jgi:hypothetical protein
LAGFHNLFRIIRLAEKQASFDAPQGIGCVGRGIDNGQVGPGPAGGTSNVPPGHGARELDIGKDDVHFAISQKNESFFASGGLDHRPAALCSVH